MDAWLPRSPETDIRLIVAPMSGVFRLHNPESVTTEGEIVRRGQVIGTVTNRGHDEPVTSTFTGFLLGVLANHTDRVRAGEPLLWLRVI
jgi:biotin carboxyl carrier protein